MINYLKLFVFTILLLLPVQAYSGHYQIPDTDAGAWSQYSFFDLRDRETFVQITNTSSDTRNLHVQIFNVADNCNENDFFDSYTPNDTHVYNMRDIQTNDTNPSGVVLPDNAYGFVIIIAVGPDGNGLDANADEVLIGNFRILDNNGYEYRTNSIGQNDENQPGSPPLSPRSRSTHRLACAGINRIPPLCFGRRYNARKAVQTLRLSQHWFRRDQRDLVS